MDIREQVQLAKTRPCRCGKDHTFGKHIVDIIDREITTLNQLESHLGCVVCGGDLDEEFKCTGRCQ